jgi:hypothetical protein
MQRSVNRRPYVVHALTLLPDRLLTCCEAVAARLRADIRALAAPGNSLRLMPAGAAAGAPCDYSSRRSGDDAPPTPAERKLAEYARNARGQEPHKVGENPQPLSAEQAQEPGDADESEEAASRKQPPIDGERQPAPPPSTSPSGEQRAAPSREAAEPPNIDSEPVLRRVIGGRLRGDDGKIIESISGRLRALGDLPLGEERGEDADPDTSTQARSLSARLVFTGGPRAGESLLVQRNTVALDRDALEVQDSSRSDVVASVWVQGTRFMLRHAGIVVSGSRPALPVVTLEDGDELAWNAHRLQFQIEDAGEGTPSA